jgi:hypothetical protein
VVDVPGTQSLDHVKKVIVDRTGYGWHSFVLKLKGQIFKGTDCKTTLNQLTDGTHSKAVVMQVIPSFQVPLASE